MTLFAVALVAWIVLTLPAAVLMGKCISRGLAPSHPTVQVPAQRSAGVDTATVRSAPARSRA